jgi:hypothetical protein
MITEEEYIKNRLDDQITWYSSKARVNKQWNFRAKSLIILFSALVSVFAGFPFATHPTAKSILLGAFGTIIAISSGLSDVLKFGEKWTQYRTTAEALTQEKMLFSTLTGPYNGAADAFKILVERTESIISKEYSSWSQYVNQEKQK